MPGPLGSRALRFGLRATLLAPLGAAASVAIVADEDPKAGSFVPLVVAITIVGIAVTFLPWDRLAGSAFGRRVLHVWAGLDLVLITLAGWSATGADLVLPLGYAVTIVFFALVFPPRSQAVYLIALLASYGAVQLSTDVDLLSFAMLAVLGVLACFLSREVRRRIALHERARVDAERRWSVVGAVATTARDAEAGDPVAVLQSIVDAVALLGYGSAAIHVADGAGRARVFLPIDIDDDNAAAVRSLPDPIRSVVLEEGRAAVFTSSDADRLTLRALSASELQALAAVPIVAGSRPAGVLLAGSADRDMITQREMDAFSMLAAQAALAVVRAQREAEEREVAERLASADRVRADVVAQLSQEIRKPLAIVTETTRALRDADEDAKARLFERLTAGTTALDVTLGGLLDVALLDAEDVPLEMAEVDLGELVTGVAGRLSGLFVDRELRVQVPEGFRVEADPALLERAVESLLAAAATSTPPRRAVEVAVTRTEGRTMLKVAGDGVIPPELLAKIREPFGDDAGVAGPVARLALASKIVELHGSELEVRSEPGQGTRVWFELSGDRAPGRAAVAIGPWLAESGPIAPEDALLPSAIAQAALAIPPPPEDEEEDRERTPGRLGAAAAALATAASAMIVTGVVPDIVPQPHAVTTNAPDGGGGAQPDAASSEKPKKKHQREDRAGDDAGGSDQGGSDGAASTDTGGTTGGASSTGSGGSTGTGTGGGGTGGGTPPAPSPSPPPPGHDGPGKSEDAPGHTKDPKHPSPSPSPSPSAPK